MHWLADDATDVCEEVDQIFSAKDAHFHGLRKELAALTKEKRRHEEEVMHLPSMTVCPETGLGGNVCMTSVSLPTRPASTGSQLVLRAQVHLGHQHKA